MAGLGLLARMARGAGRSFRSAGKHYDNSFGAGVRTGFGVGGSLPLADELMDDEEGVDLDRVLAGALTGTMLGAGAGGLVGVGRGLTGAMRSAGLNPNLVTKARSVLLSRGMTTKEINRLADDDIVAKAFPGHFRR